MKVLVEADELFPYYSISNWGSELELTEEEVLFVKAVDTLFEIRQELLSRVYKGKDLKDLKRSPEYDKAVKELLLDELKTLNTKEIT